MLLASSHSATAALPDDPPAATAKSPAIATIRVTALRQPIYGFGGSQTYNGDVLADFKNRDAVYKALFSELKLDIFRLRNYHDYAGQQAKFDRITKEFATGAKRWGTKEKRGEKQPVRLMFTSWSPPAYLKSNNLVSGRSDGKESGRPNATLKRNSDGRYAYSGFADWWLSSLRQFQKLTGSYPDYIALQNELDFAAPYEGCRFLPLEGEDSQGNELASYPLALSTVAGRIDSSLGTQAPKIVGPETFTIQKERDAKSRVETFLDPATPSGRRSLDQLFGVSFHLYGSGAEAADPAKFYAALNSVRDTFRSASVQKPLFETEFLEGDSFLSLAQLIHATLTEGDVSTYFVWMLARSTKSPGLAMVYFNPDDGTIERRERFYAMKHYSAFVGEGWNRVEADCADNPVKISAFVSPDRQELVVVLINPTGDEKRIVLSPIDGFRNASTDSYRSSQGEDGERWRDLGALPPDNTITLIKRSMATIRFRKSK